MKQEVRILNNILRMSAALLALFGFTVACSHQEQAAPQSGNAPTSIKIMTQSWANEPPTTDNVITKEVEKRTNTKLNILWSSPNKYDDKVSAMLASGDIPELTLVENPFTSQIRQLVTDGAFWDLTDFIKDYPNLNAIPKDIWNNTKMQDGRNYGIPRPRSLGGGGRMPAIRMDWLDKLNLKYPETIDDIYTVMKAFTEKDPDGNGIKDTYGYIGAWNTGLGSAESSSWIFNSFTGSVGDWKTENGKLISTYLMPEMRDALVWYHKIYSEGLIPKDFVNMPHFPDVMEMVSKGKAGIFADGLTGTFRVQSELNKISANAEMRPMTYVAGPHGKLSMLTIGYKGIYLIPKTVSQEKLKKILEFMEFGVSEEGHVLSSYGFKDVHYKEKDGFKVVTDQALKDNVSQQAWGQIYGMYDKYQYGYYLGMPSQVFERNKKIIDTVSDMGTSDPASGLYSETSQLVGSEISKRINDLMLKIVLGKEPIEAWDTYIAKLKEDKQFQKIVEEINSSYKKRMNAK
jgi:putative aldouronate transport system substrate-binding protein